jgi:hypothetical protein
VGVDDRFLSAGHGNKSAANGLGRRNRLPPTIGNRGLVLVAQALSPAEFDFSHNWRDGVFRHSLIVGMQSSKESK